MRLQFIIQQVLNGGSNVTVDARILDPATPLELAIANRIADAASAVLKPVRKPINIDLPPQPVSDDPADPGAEIIPLPPTNRIIT